VEDNSDPPEEHKASIFRVCRQYVPSKCPNSIPLLIIKQVVRHIYIKEQNRVLSRSQDTSVDTATKEPGFNSQQRKRFLSVTSRAALRDT
jgi:hypothetical protein